MVEIRAGSIDVVAGSLAQVLLGFEKDITCRFLFAVQPPYDFRVSSWVCVSGQLLIGRRFRELNDVGKFFVRDRGSVCFSFDF